MSYEKKVLAEMPKCYALCMFDGDDAKGFVAGTETDGPIRRFTLEGTPVDTIAEGPGGVMTLTQAPGRGDQLLATYKFYSPNFGGDDAKIVSYTRQATGVWKRSTLCDIPYIHRFGILIGADGQAWLIACTIKGASRKVEEDWSTPGSVYVARLDTKLENYNDDHQLELTKLAGYQLQNHGFWVAPQKDFALISTAAGVFRCTPPASADSEWDVTCLLIQPTSDIAMVDFDGDGIDEILTFSAFHGDTLSVWHQSNVEDCYKKIWTDEHKRPFLHAIWSGSFAGMPSALVGNREGGRDLLRLRYSNGTYQVETIDHDFGPANCLAFSDKGTQRIVAANRETDQLALYELMGN